MFTVREHNPPSRVILLSSAVEYYRGACHAQEDSLLLLSGNIIVIFRLLEGVQFSFIQVLPRSVFRIDFT